MRNIKLQSMHVIGVREGSSFIDFHSFALVVLDVKPGFLIIFLQLNNLYFGKAFANHIVFHKEYPFTILNERIDSIRNLIYIFLFPTEAVLVVPFQFEKLNIPWIPDHHHFVHNLSFFIFQFKNR